MAQGKFRHHSRLFKPTDAQPTAQPLTPVQVATAYNFPAGINLQNRHIAFIELCNETTFDKTNIESYLSKLGVKPAQMFFYTVDGTGDAIFPQDADGEVELDQCVAGATAPGINLHTIFSDNTDQGFVDAILYAINSLPVTPDALSISWGASESQWSAETMAAMDAAFRAAWTKGIAVYVAAGDNGSTDGIADGINHVDYPASSPFVTACGGTRLDIDAQGVRNFEKVWSLADGNGSTGGGVSDNYDRLPYQPKVLTKRGVPDVAGNADPVSGYRVKVDFADQVIGGTSAVAPLMAALHAILNSYFDKPLGNLNPVFYALEADDYFDVLVGSNGAFSANPGYDLCSGVGVPNGMAVLNYLVKSGIATVPASAKVLNKLEAAVHLALAKRPHVFGRYSLSISEIMQIVQAVITILGTLATSACQTCISELIADVSSES